MSWLSEVERQMEAFAHNHFLTYKKTEREIAAAFEIGCFHALVDFYKESGAEVAPAGLADDGSYRYLTSPGGNPDNFSFVEILSGEARYCLRQQIRIRAVHMDGDLCFAPDLVVLSAHAQIEGIRDSDYALGRRRFFSVDSDAVVAAHECKSLFPFPELLVSFVGVFWAAHSWSGAWAANNESFAPPSGVHLAPTLFVGGGANAIVRRCAAAIERCLPVNCLLGLHSGEWHLNQRVTRFLVG